MEKNNDHKVVCFGEVLWDILPSGAVPGGAPMNVAYHLHKQQKNPAVITSIGIDEKGEELINIFSDYGVCTDFSRWIMSMKQEKYLQNQMNIMKWFMIL